MSLNLIPYIIIEASPSSFLPSMNYIKGVMEEYKIKTYLFNSLIQFIQKESAFSNINSLEKVQMFWNYFYSSGCMKNKPWEAFIIKNGNWETIFFSDEEILYGLLHNTYLLTEGDVLIDENRVNDFYISSDDDN